MRESWVCRALACCCQNNRDFSKRAFSCWWNSMSAGSLASMAARSPSRCCLMSFSAWLTCFQSLSCSSCSCMAAAWPLSAVLLVVPSHREQKNCSIGTLSLRVSTGSASSSSSAQSSDPLPWNSFLLRVSGQALRRSWMVRDRDQAAFVHLRAALKTANFGRTKAAELL